MKVYILGFVLTKKRKMKSKLSPTVYQHRRLQIFFKFIEVLDNADHESDISNCPSTCNNFPYILYFLSVLYQRCIHF
uniref:Ovule protein n=1 Tax=Meloidogyne incognita TaxID=6306 RepID=A0A914KSF3_MELIC